MRQVDTMKRKQFIKGVNQIAQEGAIQIFQEFNTGMEEIIVGVVGVLQFEVLTYRLQNEYNVEVILEKLPYEYIRWVENPQEVDVARIQGTSDMKRIKDLKDNPLLLFINSWSVGMVLERNPGLKLSELVITKHKSEGIFKEVLQNEQDRCSKSSYGTGNEGKG